MARGTAAIARARHRSALKLQPQNTQNTQIRDCRRAPAGMISFCVICVFCGSNNPRAREWQPGILARTQPRHHCLRRQPRRLPREPEQAAVCLRLRRPLRSCGSRMVRGTAAIARARHWPALKSQPQNTQNTQIRDCRRAPAGMISFCVICVFCGSNNPRAREWQPSATPFASRDRGASPAYGPALHVPPRSCRARDAAAPARAA